MLQLSFKFFKPYCCNQFLYITTSAYFTFGFLALFVFLEVLAAYGDYPLLNEHKHLPRFRNTKTSAN